MTQKKEATINIKKTVNLPKTSFPMRANLAQNEPQSLKRWAKSNLYETLLEKHKNSPKFNFHDGPPYANGDIHIGHLLNKVLKDIVVRSQFASGHHCEYIPGWDCHGLPIEHKVLQELTAKDQLKKITQLPLENQKLAIRNECAKYAKKHIKQQSQQMQSLLTLANYKQPYLTMNKTYEKNVLNVFSKLVEQGIVYRKLKPVHWSIANQTALADAELEYYDKIDTSVYVEFEITNTKNIANLSNIPITQPIHLLIWTTTPWTLPANLAVAIEQTFDYSLVQTESNYLIVATNLIESISNQTKKTLTPILSIKGSELINLTYNHPFLNKTGSIINAEFVNLEDGTGLVHIAPGHGTDDYLAGQEHNLDTYCPVKADGTYDDTVPEWLRGLSIWKANPLIVEHLKTNKKLFFDYSFSHSYPHDWRSKTPVIFRSTQQWFIDVDKPLKTDQQSLRDLAIKNIDNDIEFVPKWGQNRLKGMLQSRPDWCISRQRSWGLPIPAFIDANETILLTPQSVNTIGQVFEQEGSDAWYKKSAQELLNNYTIKADTQAPKDFDVSTATKMFDIFDVWFESGSSWHAVLEERQQCFPADLYLEGSDQHRGWFHLSLLPALGIHQKSPYKQLLTHGFIVDKNGKKMSKSLGNTINVQDLLKQYGAEVTRWWVSSLAYESDIKVDLSFFDVASESYRKIRNTIRFLLSNLYDFSQPKNLDDLTKQCQNIPKNSLESLLLDNLCILQQDVNHAYKTYQFKKAHQLIYDFCNDTLSSFYCSIVKDTLYCDAPDSPKRKQIQICLWAIVEILTRLLSPILPHTAEEAYHALYNNNNLSLLLAENITLNISTDKNFWTPLIECRNQALKILEEAKNNGIENTLDAELILPNKFTSYDNETLNIADFFGVSRISFHSNDTISIKNLKDQPRCERSWKRDKTVKQRANGLFLSDRDANVLNLT